MEPAKDLDEAVARLRRKYVLCNGSVTYANMREFHSVRREAIMECIEAITAEPVFPQPDLKRL